MICGNALVPTVIALSFALIGCYALKGPFWALSTEFLVAGTAAVSEGVFADEDGSSRGGVGAALELDG